MSTTEDLIKKIMQWRTAKDPKPTLKTILSTWESIWMQKGCIADYKDRVNTCKKIMIWTGDDAYTKLETNTVIIKVDGQVPDKKTRGDKIIDPHITKGEMTGYHDIACAIIFELGNCLQSSKFLLVKKQFFHCIKPLQVAGKEFTELEAEGSLGYVRLMKAIEDTKRPYQANRDLYKYRNCGNDNEIKVVFCQSPHNVSVTNATMDFNTSLKGYTYELVAHATKDDIIQLTTKLGAIKLKLRQQSMQNAWTNLIKWLAKELGVRDKTNCDLMYDVVTEMINNLLTAGYGGSPLTDKDWLFDADMKSKLSTKSIAKNGFAIQYNNFINSLPESKKKILSKIDLRDIGGPSLSLQ